MTGRVRAIRWTAAGLVLGVLLGCGMIHPDEMAQAREEQADLREELDQLLAGRTESLPAPTDTGPPEVLHPDGNSVEFRAGNASEQPLTLLIETPRQVLRTAVPAGDGECESNLMFSAGKPGTYRVVAFFADGSIVPHAGTWELSVRVYEACYELD